MANLDDIKAALADQLAEVNNIASQVQKVADDIAAEVAAGADPQKMQDLVDQIKTQTASLAQVAAVAAAADLAANPTQLPPQPLPTPVPDTNTPANPNTQAVSAPASDAG